jgi:hypothetical protein
VGWTGTWTIYSQSGPKFGKGCDRPKYIKAMAVKKIIVVVFIEDGPKVLA